MIIDTKVKKLLRRVQKMFELYPTNSCWALISTCMGCASNSKYELKKETIQIIEDIDEILEV